MAEAFARTAAEAVSAAGFDVLLETMLTLSVGRSNTSGALVITASHNPGSYLGLKVKALVDRSSRNHQQIEALLAAVAGRRWQNLEV